MKSRTIVEIGGMISVIGSLIFVGVETVSYTHLTLPTNREV